ncbi:FAD-dependent oxidoreductase [Pseudomonas aeruginosa]
MAKVADKLVGALRLPNDQTGDCQLFTTRLAEMAKGLGVEFRFGQNIERLDFAGDRINGVLVNGELLTADHYVLALGSYSPQLLKPLGIKAPVYPLKGYSLTVPITNPEMAPTSTILGRDLQGGDHPLRPAHPRRRHGGNRRLDLSLNPRRRETLEMITTDLYPGGRRYQPGDLLDRPAPGDPGWHPDRRRHPLPRTCSSIPATAPWVGPWPAGRVATWPT